MIRRSFHRETAAVVASLALMTGQPMVGQLAHLAVSVGLGGLSLLLTRSAYGQSSESVALTAEAITVRIEGALQGSGVLVRRERERYTVLTAWHVVSAQQPSEELAIITPDGRQHPLEPGSIQKVGEADLAFLQLSSPIEYSVAKLGQRQSVRMGGVIYVAGFPLGTSAVPSRLLRFLEGRVIAYAQVAMPNGYQLLYSNPTLPGMSGGPVLNVLGDVVGIHGQGETDSVMSEMEGVAVKTGTNQGVPVSYYSDLLFARREQQGVAERQGPPAFLVEAEKLLDDPGKERHLIRLLNAELARHESGDAYYYRAYVRSVIGDGEGASQDYKKAMQMCTRWIFGLILRCGYY